MPLPLPAGDYRAYLFDCDGTIADLNDRHGLRMPVTAVADRREELFQRFLPQISARGLPGLRGHRPGHRGAHRRRHGLGTRSGARAAMIHTGPI